MKPDIIILVETHLVKKNTIKINGYENVITRNRNTNGGGLLVAQRNNLDSKLVILDINQTHEQMWIQLTGPNGKINLCIAYGLHESRCTKQEIEDWHFNIEQKIGEYDQHPVLLIGDMNAHIGNDDKGVFGNHHEINQNGCHLRNMIERRQLVLVNNTKICHGKFTRVDPTGKRSILDLIIANNRMFNLMKSMNIDEKRVYTLTRYEKVNGKNTETPSDHNSITLEINWKKPYKDPKITIWNLTDKDSKEKFTRITENVRMKESWETDGDADEKYSRWMKQIKTLMYSSFKKVTIKKKVQNSEIHLSIQHKQKLKRMLQHLIGINLENGIAVGIIRTKIKEEIECIQVQTQNEVANKLQAKMEKIISGQVDSEELWSVRKTATKQSDIIMALQDDEGNTITDPIKIKDRYIDYYQELLKPRPQDKEAEETNEEFDKCFSLYMKVKSHDQEDLNKPFTEKEMQKVFTNLKKNKSPGEDGITNELLLAFGNNLRISLLNMANWMHKHEKIPNQLLKINIKSLYKGKGLTADLKNHRGIFISSAILKFYESLMSNRTTPVIEKQGFSETQAGARKKRGISDQVFILRSIMDYYEYINKPLMIEFIDLIKAFDKMILRNVMIDLWKAGVRGKICRNIYTINQKAYIKIKTPMGLTKEAEIGETLKQGSVMASTLAALHTDGVNRLFKNTEVGVLYGNTKIHQLLFQDDIMKIEDDPSKLNMSNAIYTWFGKINRMKYHQDKSMVMITKGQNPDTNLDGNLVKNTNKYKYLADIITPDGSLDLTIQERKNQILGITAELSTIISLIDESGLHITTAIKYHEAIILPKLLTNAESWSKITTANIMELEGIQNRAIKRLLRLPQGTPSQALLNELGMWNINTIIIKKKLTYLHKVLNYPKENLTRQVLINQMNQPGGTWWSSVKETAQEIDINIDQDKLQNTSKYSWRKEIKEKLTQYQKSLFENWKTSSKKCNNLQASSSIQKYITYLNKEQAITILKERLKMTNVKAYYKNMYNDKNCRICQEKEENTQHLLECHYKNQPEKLPLITTLDNTITKIETADPLKIKELAQIIIVQ